MFLNSADYLHGLARRVNSRHAASDNCFVSLTRLVDRDRETSTFLQPEYPLRWNINLNFEMGIGCNMHQWLTRPDALKGVRSYFYYDTIERRFYDTSVEKCLGSGKFC